MARRSISALYGHIRSLWIYRWRVWKRLAKRRLYDRFVHAGSLVFDIGAHVGDRTDAFLSLGARVVSVEPQPDLARRLERRYARNRNVTVLSAAVGSEAGSTTLHLCPENPTLATTSANWVETAAHTPGFDRYAFSQTVAVEMITLDMMVQQFGVPDFVKIDVEGAEDAALAGLNKPIPAFSIEFLSQNRESAFRALEQSRRIGGYRYAFSPGETLSLPNDEEWLDAETITAFLRKIPSEGTTGDVYARLERLFVEPNL